jgi:phospholipid-translocating ATPase
MVVCSFALLVGAGMDRSSIILGARYCLLLSSIIPISLRVNLDLAKLYYCHKIEHDKHIHGMQAKNTNIPEELGRIQVFLTDKTGTLTNNVMSLNKAKISGEG